MANLSIILNITTYYGKQESDTYDFGWMGNR